MIRGNFSDIRAVLDYLETVEPVRTGGYDPCVWAPVDLGVDGNLWATPHILAKAIFPEVTQDRMVLVGRMLRALGWKPFIQPGAPAIRRAYYLEPPTASPEVSNG